MESGARARMPRHSRPDRQHRTAHRGDRPPSRPERLLRSAGFPEDRARQGARDRAERLLRSKGAGSGAALPPSLRAELEGAGVKTRQAYATADLGVIAYETDGPDGALSAGHAGQRRSISSRSWLPGPTNPVRGRQRRREVVVTAPAWGLPAAALRHRRPRPGPRICASRLPERAPTRRQGEGLVSVHPGQIVEVGKRHPELGAVRLVVRREGEQDVDAADRPRLRRPIDGLAGGGRRRACRRDEAARRGGSSSRRARCPTTARSSPMSALRREGLVNAHDEQLAQFRLPIFEMRPSFGLPPEEFCLGERNSRGPAIEVLMAFVGGAQASQRKRRRHDDLRRAGADCSRMQA